VGLAVQSSDSTCPGNRSHGGFPPGASDAGIGLALGHWGVDGAGAARKCCTRPRG
jgi:hypothetical protein